MYCKIHYWHAFQRSRPLFSSAHNFLSCDLSHTNDGQAGPTLSAQLLVFKYPFCVFKKKHDLQWYYNHNYTVMYICGLNLVFSLLRSFKNFNCFNFPNISPSERLGLYENRVFENKQWTKVQHRMAKCKSPHKLYRKFQNLATWKYIRRKTGQPQNSRCGSQRFIPESLGGTWISTLPLVGKVQHCSQGGSADASDLLSQDKVGIFHKAAV